MTDTEVWAFAINGSGDIFAGTRSSGVFRSIESTTAVEQIFARTPSSFALKQNYPNPFNPTTIIKYQLSAASDVELAVYNQLGQEVRKLIKERQPSGAYQIEWNGRDNRGKLVVSDVYLYRLKADSYIQTRKMVLLR